VTTISSNPVFSPEALAAGAANAGRSNVAAKINMAAIDVPTLFAPASAAHNIVLMRESP
jgi:hypothetical protein